MTIYALCPINLILSLRLELSANTEDQALQRHLPESHCANYLLLVTNTNTTSTDYLSLSAGVCHCANYSHEGQRLLNTPYKPHIPP